MTLELSNVFSVVASHLACLKRYSRRHKLMSTSVGKLLLVWLTIGLFSTSYWIKGKKSSHLYWFLNMLN